MKKLISKNNQVDFIMKAVNDFVKSKMPLEDAQRIINEAKTVDSSRKFNGFNTVVDKMYYFPMEREV